MMFSWKYGDTSPKSRDASRQPGHTSRQPGHTSRSLRITEPFVRHRAGGRHAAHTAHNAQVAYTGCTATRAARRVAIEVRRIQERSLGG